MMEVKTEKIKEVVYELCIKANTCLNSDVYTTYCNLYKNETDEKKKSYIAEILKNAQIANSEKMPLCQDTGQVVIFLEVGQDIYFSGEYIEDAINSAVEECYKDNFFRKSVVKNSIFNRENTKTNTPCIIHTKYIKESEIKIKVLIKGAGSENKSKLIMLMPTANEDEILKECAEAIIEAGVNACPPMFIGIGIGGTAEKALLESKEVLLQNKFTHEEKLLAEQIRLYVNEKAPKEFNNLYAASVKIKTLPTHIACLPVGITINCHSYRYSEAVINSQGVVYKHKTPDFIEPNKEEEEIREIDTWDLNVLKTLKEGEKVLLKGELYVARDLAHKKMQEMLKENKPLPFKLEEKIILYAGPCPNKPGGIIGSIGPTTSERMDKYAIDLYKEGIFGTIGKGTRNEKVSRYIKESGKKYFIIQGGIAALLSKHITKSEIVGFEDLGTEAIYRIEVSRLPVTVAI